MVSLLLDCIPPELDDRGSWGRAVSMDLPALPRSWERPANHKRGMWYPALFWPMNVTPSFDPSAAGDFYRLTCSRELVEQSWIFKWKSKWKKRGESDHQPVRPSQRAVRCWNLGPPVLRKQRAKNFADRSMETARALRTPKSYGAKGTMKVACERFSATHVHGCVQKQSRRPFTIRLILWAR